MNKFFVFPFFISMELELKSQVPQLSLLYPVELYADHSNLNHNHIPHPLLNFHYTPQPHLVLYCLFDLRQPQALLYCQ